MTPRRNRRLLCAAPEAKPKRSTGPSASAQCTRASPTSCTSSKSEFSMNMTSYRQFVVCFCSCTLFFLTSCHAALLTKYITSVLPRRMRRGYVSWCGRSRWGRTDCPKRELSKNLFYNGSHYFQSFRVLSRGRTDAITRFLHLALVDSSTGRFDLGLGSSLKKNRVGRKEHFFFSHFVGMACIVVFSPCRKWCHRFYLA